MASDRGNHDMGKLWPLYCAGENVGLDEKKLNFQIVIRLGSCIIAWHTNLYLENHGLCAYILLANWKPSTSIIMRP